MCHQCNPSPPKVPILAGVSPSWGKNYAPGFVGFTFYDRNLISIGIAWFSREGWFKMSKHPVSHTFVVSGADECIEALPSGVVRSPLSKYFNDPHCHVFFKQPRAYDPDLGASIISAAAEHLGDKYNFRLIAANFAAKCMAGRIVNKLSFGGWNRLLCWAASSKHLEICSTVVAQALNAQPELANKGCLHQPINTITPEDLRSDWVVFERWKMFY